MYSYSYEILTEEIRDKKVIIIITIITILIILILTVSASIICRSNSSTKKENFSVYASDEPYLLRDVEGYKNLHYNPTSVQRKIDTMNADYLIENQVGYLNYRGRPHGIA